MITLQSNRLIFLAMKIFKMCSLSNFQMYSMILLTVVTTQYIISPGLTYFIIFFFNKIWVLLVSCSHNMIVIDFPSLFIPPNTKQLFASLIFLMWATTLVRQQNLLS